MTVALPIKFLDRLKVIEKREALRYKNIFINLSDNKLKLLYKRVPLTLARNLSKKILENLVLIRR